MKVVRLVLLLLLVAAAYFAQYLMDHRSLSEFFPAWWLEIAPGFYRFTRWLPDDLLDLALWLAIASAVGFGLLAPVWQGEALFQRISLGARVRRVVAQNSGLGAARSILLIGAGAALLCVILVGLGQKSLGIVLGLWLPAMVLLLAGYAVWDGADAGAEARWERPKGEQPAYFAGRAIVHPTAGWPILVLILIAAGAAYSYALVEVPIRIEEAAAQAGLQARSLLAGSFHPLAPGATYAPTAVYLPLAVFIGLTGDGLLGMRLAGMLAALATVVATWLVGCELFRRTPVLGEYQEMIEDDGRWIALAAAAIAAGQTATFYFAHLPLTLSSTMWGTLGAWLMLRGMRRRSRVHLMLSGILAGVASLTSPGGITFVLVGLGWWVGVRLLTPTWTVENTSQTPARRRGRLLPWMVSWAGGLLVFLAPFVGSWIDQPSQLAAYLFGGWGGDMPIAITTGIGGAATAQAALESPLVVSGEPRVERVETGNPIWTRIRQTVLAFHFTTDQSPVFGFDDHWLHSLLAPLLLLSVGALILSLDRPIGWLLTVWLALAVVAAGMLSPVAPYWPMLLPALPASALALAFGIDRLRVTWLENAGTWALHATIYLAAGIIVGAGLLSWVGFYQFAAVDSDLQSVVGRSLRELEAGRAVALVDPGGELERALHKPAALFLDNGRMGDRAVVPIVPPHWPERLPGGTRVLITPWYADLLAEVQSRYPGGRLYVQRNGRGDPLLYAYDLAP